MDRAEKAGFGASVAGHALLVGLLVTGFVTVRPIDIPKRQAVEVSLIAETALESGAPEISNEAPAPKLAEEEAPIAPEPPPPEPIVKPKVEPVTPPKPVVTPKPVPKPAVREAVKPTPRDTAKPQAKAVPQKPPAKSGGRLTGLPKGLTDDEGGRATAPPAATVTPQVQASLIASIRRQLKPHWVGRAPTGADAELLRTELAITLARDGSVTKIDFLGQTGVTPSNRPQAQLHKDMAIRAVRLASPFQLPVEYYDAWKVIESISFDKRLSQ